MNKPPDRSSGTTPEADAVEPDRADAVASDSEAPPMKVNALSRRVHYPNAYTWLLLLSAMDVMLTWVILLFGGAEVNPIAERVIDRFGLNGMIIYKFALIVVFITICEIVGSLRDTTGWYLSRFSVAIASVPVVWALFLLWRHNA